MAKCEGIVSDSFAHIILYVRDQWLDIILRSKLRYTDNVATISQRQIQHPIESVYVEERWNGQNVFVAGVLIRKFVEFGRRDLTQICHTIFIGQQNTLRQATGARREWNDSNVLRIDCG